MATGQPRLVNVFASWCVPCIAEAPLLMELKRQGVPIDAIAVRDQPEDVADFLGRHGDPFERIGADPESRVQIALGSSGVPETFIVDGRGIIRYQHMGPIEPGDVPAILARMGGGASEALAARPCALLAAPGAGRQRPAGRPLGQ